MKGSDRIATRLGLIVTLMALPVLAACGGDESSVRSEFIKQANRICKENNDYLQQEMLDAFGPDQRPDAKTGIRFTREVWVPNLRQQDEDLRELEWPAEDQAEIEEMLAEIESATTRVEADPSLSSQGLFDEATRDLEEYGIGSCGSP